MFDIFEFLYKDVEKIELLNQELEKKSTFFDKDLVFQLKKQKEVLLNKINNTNEQVLIILIVAFLLGIVVNQFFNTAISVELFWLEFIVFINVVLLLIFANESFKLINLYKYNKFLIFLPIFLIPLIGQVRFTISADCHTINWYDFFQASYLLVGLLFYALLVEIINFIDKIKSLYGYAPPSGNGIGGL